MRVLLVSRYYPPVVGGIEAHVYHLGSALLELGQDVTVLSSKGPIVGDRPPDGPPVIDVATSNRHYLRGVEYMLGGRKRLERLLLERRFDIVHWHDLYADWFITEAARSDAAIVFTNHSREFLTWHASRWRWAALRFMLRHNRAFISPSRELQAKTRDVMPPGLESLYIPNGVDTRLFRPSPADRSILTELGAEVAPEDRILLCPRRLETKNGIEYLVRGLPELLSRVPTARCVIAGGGFPENLQRYQRIAADLGVAERLTFVGSVPHEMMQRLLPVADAVVMPSLAEATSLACLEAMACGRPVVATNVGGLPELIEDGQHGLLVPPRDPPALAAAAARLLQDEALASELGAAASRRAHDHYSWLSVAERTLAVYERALTG